MWHNMHSLGSSRVTISSAGVSTISLLLKTDALTDLQSKVWANPRSLPQTLQQRAAEQVSRGGPEDGSVTRPHPWKHPDQCHPGTQSIHYCAQNGNKLVSVPRQSQY